MSPRPLPLLIVLLLALSAGPSGTGRAADVAPGTRFEVRPGDLPPPSETRSAQNRPRALARPTAGLPRVPAGFAVNLFAAGLSSARNLITAPNGDLFLAESRAGRITLLRDDDGDGVADLILLFAGGLQEPYGLAVRPDALYVADLRGAWRFDYEAGDTSARGEPELITPAGAFGPAGGHRTRNLVFSHDGARFYVAIGSAGNIAEDPLPRASIQVFEADGSGQRSFATGLRNPVGMAIHPDSGDLYVVVNERDGLGDELVPDYLTRVEDGDFFGWPYAYIGTNPQPGFAERRADLVARSRVPDLLFLSHSAPLGLVFYDHDAFPDAYRGNAFVALHGSWNAARPRGYMVARVPFEDGRPAGYYEAFMTGFWIAGDRQAGVWGRPAGLAVAADGSLLVADDLGNRIWRVSRSP
jgi:glucose/arabinose dehydrogenase